MGSITRRVFLSLRRSPNTLAHFPAARKFTCASSAIAGSPCQSDLLRSVVALTCKSTAKGGVCDVYLVGTCHISAKSCREVEAVIRHLKPEVVFLELCSRRVAALTPPNLKDLKELTMEEMIEMWKKNHNALEIYGWILSKGLSELEVFPGSEFGVAYEEARKYGGKVILGDRPVQITVGRTRAMMPLWHKIKLLYSLLFSSDDALSIPLEKMDDDDVMIFVQEMGKKYPTLVETFVHERDQYMSSKLLKLASKHRSVVAVVGKGHLQGIKKHWQQPVVLEDLMVIPSKKPGSSTRRILKSMGVAVTAAAIVSEYPLLERKRAKGRERERGACGCL